MPTTSPKFSWNASDFLKSLAVAAISQPLIVILTSFSAGHFNINWTEQWHLAVSAGAAYLIKNYFSGPVPMKNSTPGLTKMSIVIGLMLLSSVSFGQSMFKPLPLTPQHETPSPFLVNRATGQIIGPNDSLPNISAGHFQGFRFSGPDMAFAVPDFSIYTGLGIEYVSASADPNTGKWVYDFTIGPRVYGGANLGAPTVRAIGAVGIRFTTLKEWLTIGIIYNLASKKPQMAVGNPTAFIPGLN